jgi:hypothetical protein
MPRACRRPKCDALYVQASQAMRAAVSSPRFRTSATDPSTVASATPALDVKSPIAYRSAASAQRHKFLLAHALVGGEHDAEAVHRILHMVGEVDVLADRVQ